MTTQDVNNNQARVDYYISRTSEIMSAHLSLSRQDETVAIALSCLLDSATIIDEPAYYMSPIEPWNWGMWILQAVPAALDFVKNGQKGVLSCWHYFSWQQTLMGMCGVPRDKLLQINGLQPYFFKHLRFNVYPAVDLFVGERDRSSFLAMSNFFSKISGQQDHDKIFISRGSMPVRRGARTLVNEAELGAALIEKGLTIVDPANLSIVDQIAIFASANVVVGLGGVGMFNVVFCKPDTKVVAIESNNVFIHNHANMFLSLDLKYGIIFGMPDPNDDAWPHQAWSIDVAKAVKAIMSFVE